MDWGKYSEHDWAQLNNACKLRRAELDLTQVEAATKSDGRISAAAWTLLESSKPKNFRDKTVKGIEQALIWPKNTVVDILDGTLSPEAVSVMSRGDADLDQAEARIEALHHATQLLAEMDNPTKEASDAVVSAAHEAAAALMGSKLNRLRDETEHADSDDLASLRDEIADVKTQMAEVKNMLTAMVQLLDEQVQQR